jgi:hypothetical protein
LAKTLIINNTPYNYPTSGDEPGWGGEATGWAEGVTNVLSDLLGPNDILETAFNIANNQTDNSGTNGDITGLVFNAASVRATEIRYSIFRVSTSTPSGKTETGTIQLIYDNNIGWSINQGNILGSSGVTFTVTPSGQIKYKSTDIGSLNYIGTMKFRAKSLQQ